MAQNNVVETLERPREHRENRKKNRGRKVEENQARAVAKFIRVPPRKARLVIDAVRGRYAQDALAFLRFVPNRAAGYIAKVVASAVANAANNHDLDPNKLKVIEARVDEGPRMKRVQPRAQGRAYRILKRMSHITVIVEEQATRKPVKPKKTTPARTVAPKASKPAPEAPAAEETKPVVVAEETAPVAPVEQTTPEATPEVTETPAEETTTEATEAATEAADTK